MGKLGEKYIAGFLDADGSFGVKFLSKNRGFFPSLWLQFSQETSKNKVLHLIQEKIEGTIHQSGLYGQFSNLNIPPRKARMLLGRISKYLVVKRRYSEVILEFLDKIKPPCDREEMERCLIYLKAQRKIPETRMPNYPSRQWVAGYFDGDGCIACSFRSENGRVYLSARITCLEREAVGLRLLQKAFGGEFYTVEKPHGNYPMWVLNLEPSKVKKFLQYFMKHSVVKRSQLYFVLGCAKGGNYRNGKPIHDILAQLKMQEQRLNDPDVDVTPLLAQIKFDVPDQRGWHMRKR